jgi:hypothetical protein
MPDRLDSDRLRGVAKAWANMPSTKPQILWTLYRVWRVWRRCPDQRLGQLIDNAMFPTRISATGRTNLFNVRDEKLVEHLDVFAKKHLR